MPIENRCVPYLSVEWKKALKKACPRKKVESCCSGHHRSCAMFGESPSESNRTFLTTVRLWASSLAAKGSSSFSNWSATHSSFDGLGSLLSASYRFLLSLDSFFRLFSTHLTLWSHLNTTKRHRAEGKVSSLMPIVMILIALFYSFSPPLFLF